VPHPGGGPIYFPRPPAGGDHVDNTLPDTEGLPPIVVWVPGIGWIEATPGVPPKPEPEPTPEPEPK
jgi:hypothetical protein